MGYILCSVSSSIIFTFLYRSMNFILHFHKNCSQPGNSEEQQQELDFCASVQDSTGHSSPVVYTLKGVGISERKAILALKSQLLEVENLREKERSALNAEIEKLKAEKLAVEQKLDDVTEQLNKSLQDGHTKDEQLNAQSEEIKAKDEELKLKERELSDLVKELKTKLAAKEEELDKNMLKSQEQKNELEKQLNEKIAELRKQKEVTESLRRENFTLKCELETSSLRLQIEMKDLQIKYSEEIKQTKDRQYQLELQTAMIDDGMSTSVYLSYCIFAILTLP